MEDWGSWLVRRRLERALVSSSLGLLEVEADGWVLLDSVGVLLGVDGRADDGLSWNVGLIVVVVVDPPPPPPSNEVTGSSSRGIDDDEEEDAAVVPSRGLLFLVALSFDAGAAAGIIIGRLSSMAKIGSSSILLLFCFALSLMSP